MKKIILMLVLFMPFKVFGSSYYTDYGFKERTDCLCRNGCISGIVTQGWYRCYAEYV